MADQKRWFKLWTSILSDDDFDPSREGGLRGLGRVAMLGAYTALHGKSGHVEILPATLLRLLDAQSLEELTSDIALKNVVFEEGQNHYGKLTVTWRKWRQYQEDSTARERMQLLRSKKRGEERRGEEIKNPPAKPADLVQVEPEKSPEAVAKPRPMSAALREAGERIWKTDKKKYDKLWGWIGEKRKNYYSDQLLTESLIRFEPYCSDPQIGWYEYLNAIVAKEQSKANGRASEAEGERFKREEREWLASQSN